MTRELALSYLTSLNESRIKPGLDRIRDALFILGEPHLKYPRVLVGGTNGKGSVATFIAGTLSSAGYRAGLFTSPHLHVFEERIVVDGLPVSHEELSELIETVKDTGVELTYFEFSTVLSLLHFARRSVDVALLEVGLGGRWDATNIADPILSVITSVGLDHQNWLGNSLEDVALEKAGIMREGMPVVVGPLVDSARKVVLEQARSVGARVLLFGRDFRVYPDSNGQSMSFEGRKWNIEGLIPGLKGLFQFDNAACALAALESLSGSGFEIGIKQVVHGLESSRWPGRFQEFEGSPRIIVDSAHNPAAVRALIASLGHGKKVVWLFSALSDKDIGGMTDEMVRISKNFVVVPLDHPRAVLIEELRRKMPENALIKTAVTTEQGIELARNMAGEEGCIVVAGSVILAGEVLRQLKKEGFEV